MKFLSLSLGLVLSCGVPLAARAFSAADADTIFEAHTKAFYRTTNSVAWHTKSTDGGKADYWMQAEQLEMVLDAYERTTNAQQLAMFTNLFHGFLANHGTTWARNPYNDDIMWMVIACARAHLLTGNAEFRDVARTNFDLCYERAASTNLGGGLWWKTDNRSKNACVNGPGAIAAFLLGKATGDDAYFTKATNLFLWERATLFDPTTGKIFDNIRTNGRIAQFSLTYNQGTFIGAANFLGYTNEARLAALYTMNQMCKDGYLPPGGENGDGGGFNGIGVRWIARFMKDRGEQATFEPWLQKNAEAAWQARRPSDNLSWCRWPQPTPEGLRYSWGCSSSVVLLQVAPPTEAGNRRRGRTATPPPVTAKPEELAKIKEKTEQIEALVKDLKAKDAKPELVVDVEVYAHAGRMLLEYPDMFANQAAIDRAFSTLDQGIERGQQLQVNQPQWNQGRKQIHAYISEIDGAVLPYGVTLPANYDPGKPTRLYVWLHGRQNNTMETEFIRGFLSSRISTNVADHGQIQLDCFGRINGAGWHWAGEMDVFESIAAVKKRFHIDDKRIILRGFSQGGEGAWHISLHHPDRFAAAEIGAGTVSRTAQQPGLTPYQLATLRIWENISEWALNIYNLPLAGHDGENDPGQLESSLRARAQLEKEEFPSVGDPDYLRSQGAPGLWLISKDTGHGTSPLVRQRLDAFLKEHGDKGQSSPDHIRFLTYTTRYNRDYWVSLDGLEKHYERAEVDAQRTDAGASYEIKTKNLTRLVLRETERAREIKIDGQTLKVKAGPELALHKNGSSWEVSGPASGLHKTHALQGPIDDAFLDPFLLVRPTGKPWNEEVNQQALRTMARFDRLWGRFFRGHPFVKDDTDVTEADFIKYHVVLFGDPGSNKWIEKLNGQLPFKWTRQDVTLGAQTFPASECFPALIYPNPLNPSKYVVLNTGLTIADRGYNGDYGTPLWGDYAIVKVKPGAPLPEMLTAGLFDENWQLPK